METQEDLVARIQAAAGVICDMLGIFPRVRHDIIRRYTKCIEVGGGHIQHLVLVNKMVFTDSISIVSFTTFLAFVAQTAKVLLHISETLAVKEEFLNIRLLAKSDHMVGAYPSNTHQAL